MSNELPRMSSPAGRTVRTEIPTAVAVYLRLELEIWATTAERGGWQMPHEQARLAIRKATSLVLRGLARQCLPSHTMSSEIARSRAAGIERHGQKLRRKLIYQKKRFLFEVSRSLLLILLLYIHQGRLPNLRGGE